MIYKKISENKAYRYVNRQLAQINTIIKYHGKADIESSVRIINALKKRAQERIDNGADEASVNKWLDEMIGCFKEQGFTYEEISNYWRDKVNKLKADAEKQLMQKALFLQKLSMEEQNKNPQKSIAIYKDYVKYIEAVAYISENINYN